MTLKCEIDTPEMDERVEAAAHAYFVDRSFYSLSTTYDHGHWWVIIDPEEPDDGDEIYSVHDAEGGDSVDGFCFERV